MNSSFTNICLTWLGKEKWLQQCKIIDFNLKKKLTKRLRTDICNFEGFQEEEKCATSAIGKKKRKLKKIWKYKRVLAIRNLHRKIETNIIIRDFFLRSSKYEQKKNQLTLWNVEQNLNYRPLFRKFFSQNVLQRKVCFSATLSF